MRKMKILHIKKLVDKNRKRVFIENDFTNTAKRLGW
jgi:hypothetical protein